MKKILSVGIVACALAFCLALVGCGGGNSIDESKFVGDWTMTEMASEGETMDMSEFSALGIECTLTLTKDHKATLSLFGSDVDGEWKATAADKGQATLDEMGNFDFSISDNTLTMEDGSDQLVFKKKA